MAETREISIGDVQARADALHDEKMVINVGPSHPTTHGVLRLVMELDGDIITKVDPVIGHLHRGSQKIAENMNYNQFIPYTDRLDYLAPLANNMAYAIAVEKLAGVQVPERCEAIRVITAELARIASHLVGVAAFTMDTGAWTPFMYCFAERENLNDLFEELTGARFTTSYTRIGGVTRDIPEGWTDKVLAFLDNFGRTLDEIRTMVERNRIFYDRCVGVGVISREQALDWGLTGVNLRSSGVDWDLRRDKPYSGYEKYDFDIPLGSTGDCYDRFLTRGEEIRQSVRIVRQAIEQLPDGLWYSEDAKRIYKPQKDKVLTSMEELIQNFMLVTQGPQIPEGEVYFEAENPKGALGFYVVSKGGGVPYRLKIRGPSFSSLSILGDLLPGHMMTDITTILGSLDFVMGECDR